MNAVAAEVPATVPYIVHDFAFYQDVARERIRRLKWLQAHPAEIPKLLKYYATHIADMVNDWGVTFDPRNVRRNLPVVMPFVLDPRQREWIDWTFENWRAGEYGGTVKSRDVGVSWLLVGASISLCVCYDNLGIGWGSFKREKVDWRGDMGSLFEKGRAYLDALPREFRGGYDEATCSLDRRLIIPNTNSSIIGEIGDNVGRGNRTSIYFTDETAHFEHDKLIDAALSKTTDCRQDVSSVFGMTNTFAERMHKKGANRFDFHWRHNPRMTQADYDKFLDDWGPVTTAQELDMNFQASQEGIVIPATWVNAAVDADQKLGIELNGVKSGSLDVADEGIDKNAVAVRQGMRLTFVESFTGKDSDIYATVEKAFLLLDLRGCDTLRYDADGVGAGVRGDARKVNELRPGRAIAVRPFRGSAAVVDPKKEMVPGRKNEDMFKNLKAQSWWWLRLLFQNTFRAVNGKPYDPDMLIVIDGSMENLTQLLIELSQPTYSQDTAGRMLIDKQPDGTKSPNLGDAVMMVYAPGRKPMRIDERILDDETDTGV